MQVSVSTPAVPVAVLQVRQEEVQVDLGYLQTERSLRTVDTDIQYNVYNVNVHSICHA